MGIYERWIPEPSIRKWNHNYIKRHNINVFNQILGAYLKGHTEELGVNEMFL